MKKSVLGKNWKVLSDAHEEITHILLANRKLTSKKQIDEFLDPPNPADIRITDIGISKIEMKKAVNRINKAIKNKEKIIIYGDYDADGICASAVLWEALYSLAADVLPYLPERFSEGYGINPESVEKLKNQNPGLKLIITVDNGIVARDAVKKANKLGIDVIISDHHQKEKILPKAYCLIHTTQTCGSGLAWFLAREIKKSVSLSSRSGAALLAGLELVAIGTIADQVPLVGINRSLVKWGLGQLNKTKRLGLLSLLNEAAVEGKITPYTVGFVIAPRINAMGRLGHAIDSLRLLCTKNVARAGELSKTLGSTNRERQRIVEEVVISAREIVMKSGDQGFIVVSHESYHEGVIGLAASRLADEFNRPAIVFSVGVTVAKASARSIPGINIIEVIRRLDGLLLNGGGHEMAAGFSINTKDLKKFKKELNKLAKIYLTGGIMQKTLKIDTQIMFDQINSKLYKDISKFEPFGLGNSTPTFVSKDLDVVGSKTVGAGNKHLKLKLRQNGKSMNAIAFGMGAYSPNITKKTKVDAVYSVEQDDWNGGNALQLKIKDLGVYS